MTSTSLPRRALYLLLLLLAACTPLLAPATPTPAPSAMPAPTSTPVPTVTPTPAPTAFDADWVTQQYLEVTIKFPPDWKVQADTTAIQAGPPSWTGALEIKLTDEFDNQNEQSRETTLTLDGHEGKVRWSRSSLCAEILFPIADHSYRFSMHRSLCEGEIGEEHFGALLESILATVRFAEHQWREIGTPPAPAPELGKTATYSDSIIGYAIDCPEQWQVWIHPGTDFMATSHPGVKVNELPPDAVVLSGFFRRANPERAEDELINAFLDQMEDGGLERIEAEEWDMADGSRLVFVRGEYQDIEMAVAYAVINGYEVTVWRQMGAVDTFRAVVQTLRPLQPVER